MFFIWLRLFYFMLRFLTSKYFDEFPWFIFSHKNKKTTVHTKNFVSNPIEIDVFISESKRPLIFVTIFLKYNRKKIKGFNNIGASTITITKPSKTRWSFLVVCFIYKSYISLSENLIYGAPFSRIFFCFNKTFTVLFVFIQFWH